MTTDQEIITTATFDYGVLDMEARIIVQQRTGEIQALMKRSTSDIIEIGQKLIEVKERLEHGEFTPWLRSEFDWSLDTAQRYMRVATAFAEKPQIAVFAPSALYLLAAPSTPDAAREEAITRAEQGDPITHQVAQQIVAQHKPPAAEKAPKPPPKPCERCGKPAVGYFNIDGVGTHLCAACRDEAQRPKPIRAEPAQQSFAEEEIAAAPPPAPAPVLTPLTPAAPTPVLTPLASLSAGLDVQARKLLAAKYHLLRAALDLIAEQIRQAGEAPIIITIHEDAARQAARLLLNNPSFGMAAYGVAAGATVEEAPAAIAQPAAPAAAAPPALFTIVERKMTAIEARISEGRLTGEEPSLLRACRSDLDDLADDVNVPTDSYDALSARIGEAQARLAEPQKEAAA